MGSITHAATANGNLFSQAKPLLTPVAGLLLTRLGFENIFKAQGIFKTQKSALLVLWKEVMNPALQSLDDEYSLKERNIGWLNLNSSFRKRTMKSKAPTWSPQEISGFLKILGFFEPNRVEWTHLARILELLQHYLKTFLNFEHSLRFENLFKTKLR